MWIPLVGTACASEGVDEYRAALNASDYIGYRIVEADENTQRRRNSPESFNDDVLVGDFNFDERADFAVILSRPVIEEEKALLPKDKNPETGRAFLAVVCNGLDDTDSTKADYGCMPISETIVGGFGAELDLLDLEKWGDVSVAFDAYGNPQCPVAIQSIASVPLLSLDEPNGRCTTFFYPDEGVGYGRCTYCAD